MTKYNEIETEKLGKILKMQCQFRKWEEANGYTYQEIFDNLRTTQALLKKGANPNGRYPDGCNFLEKVIECQDYDIFKKLVKAGAKLQSSNNVPLLYKAVSAVTNQNGFNILKFLCDKGCTLEGLPTADKLSCIRWNENYISESSCFACTLLMIEKGMFEEEFPIIIAFFERFLSTEHMFAPENMRIDAMKKAHESYLASQRNKKITHQNPNGWQKVREDKQNESIQ